MKQKAIVCILLILSLLASFGTAIAADTDVPADPDPVEPYTGLASATAALTIDSDGTAHCSAYVALHNGYTASVYMSLQQLKEIWVVYASWSKSGTSPIVLTGSCKVETGYSYRVCVVVFVYDSNGNYVEKVIVHSPISSY